MLLAVFVTLRPSRLSSIWASITAATRPRWAPSAAASIGTRCARAAANVMLVSVLLWHDRQPAFSTKVDSVLWSSGRLRASATRADGAGDGAGAGVAKAPVAIPPWLARRRATGVS